MREQQQIYKDYMGNTYEDLENMCAYHGTTVKTFNKRLKEGLTLKECLKSPVVFINGVRYPSKKVLCEEFGVNLKTIESRQRRGETLEEALSHEVTPGRCRPVKYRGVDYQSITELCKAYNVDVRHYYARKSRGAKDVMGCLGHVPETIILTEPFEYRGKKYTKYEDMCHDYRTNPRNFYNCIAENWTFNQIFGFEKPPAKNGLKIEIHGMKLYSKQEICKVFGVTVGQLDTARRKGLPIEHCVNFDKGRIEEYLVVYRNIEEQRKKKAVRATTPSINTLKLITYRGKEYKGIEDFATKHGQPYKQVAGRLSRGWSLDEALYGKI